MFESFHSKDKKLTSLGLGTPAPRPTPPAPGSGPAQKAEVKAEAKPPAVPLCVGQIQSLESAYLHFTGARNKFERIVADGIKPETLSYLVFPQQGLTYSLTTSDGLRTIVPIFTSKFMAEAYIAEKKLAAVAAACRFEGLHKMADRWIGSGINFYALNTCCRCQALNFHSIAELQSEDTFLSTWRLDFANRRQFAEGYGRNAAAAIGTNAKQCRVWLEGVRDHIDPANPYLHWVIAILAGMAGDMEANAASIRRLAAFGAPFDGKLQGTSFDPSVPGSQINTLSEAMVGLGVSLGYIVPDKIRPAPKDSDS